jgi:hypothetical protein
MSPHAPEPSLLVDLHRARTALIEAELACHPGERFLAAHLAALRVAAIVLSVRARPGRGSSRPRNAWQVLAEVAPELGEWAAFFAASEGKREAVRAGATAIINAREADDLVRDAQAFLRLVEQALGRSGRLHQGGSASLDTTARGNAARDITARGNTARDHTARENAEARRA